MKHEEKRSGALEKSPGVSMLYYFHYDIKLYFIIVDRGEQ